MADEFGKRLFEWRAPEFSYSKKSASWYVSAVVVLVVAIVLAGLSGQWILAVVFLLLGLVIFQLTRVKPKVLDYAVTDVGIGIGDKFYTYDRLKLFWILEENQTLNIETVEKFAPNLVIPMPVGRAKELRLALQDLIPEKVKVLGVFGKILMWIRF